MRWGRALGGILAGILTPAIVSAAITLTLSGGSSAPLTRSQLDQNLSWLQSYVRALIPGTGIVAQTTADGTNAAPTFAARIITAGSSGNLTCTNGDGIAGNPTCDLTNPIVRFSILSDASTTTSSTPSDVAGLSGSVTNNINYNVRCALLFRTSVASGGLILALTYTASASAFEVKIPANADGVGRNFEGRITATGGTVTAQTAPTNNVTFVAIVDGWFKASADSTFQVQYGSEDNSSTITPKAGSNCTLTKLG